MSQEAVQIRKMETDDLSQVVAIQETIIQGPVPEEWKQAPAGPDRLAAEPLFGGRGRRPGGGLHHQRGLQRRIRLQPRRVAGLGRGQPQEDGSGHRPAPWPPLFSTCSTGRGFKTSTPRSAGTRWTCSPSSNPWDSTRSDFMNLRKRLD